MPPTSLKVLYNESTTSLTPSSHQSSLTEKTLSGNCAIFFSLPGTVRPSTEELAQTNERRRNSVVS